MSRKAISAFIVLALLIVALVPSGAGLAAASTTPVYGNRYGKVTAVAAGSITIKNLSGVEKTIVVSSTTRLYGVNGVKKTVADVKVGQWIFASGTVDNTARVLNANNIILVGVRYVSATYWDYPREFGTVISVVPEYGEFFMNTAMSGTVKVITDADTVFLTKKVKSVSKISEGMKAAVAGPMTVNGFIRAKVVIVFSVSGSKK